MIGHTPGGVGVFEAAMVFTLSGNVQTHQMVAALLAYRAIYFGVPLIVSAGAACGLRRPRAERAVCRCCRPQAASKLAPLFLSLVTFVVGGMLVISSATPAFWQRIHILRDVAAAVGARKLADAVQRARRAAAVRRAWFAAAP